MTASTLSLVFEALVAILLLVMIFYAARLNQRLAGLRAHEAELQDGIARFGDATARAEASAGRLKTAGAEAERSVRAAVDRAQAIRDELIFLIDRADAAMRGFERTAAKSPPPSKTRTHVRAADERTMNGGDAPRRNDAPRDETAHAVADAKRPRESDGAGASARSAAERELLRAIRAAHGER
jgi:hypothetical protein